MTTRHFVHIAFGKTDYRFFGRGEWERRNGRKWEPINAIYIPGDVLKLAATQCHPDAVPSDIEFIRRPKKFVTSGIQT